MHCIALLFVWTKSMFKLRGLDSSQDPLLHLLQSWLKF